MNKNRARTQRRLAARVNRHKPTSKAAMLVAQKLNDATNPRAPHTPALDFEIQTRDKSGRWRKLAGAPRVHTFGLARLRWWKLSVPSRSVVSTPTYRIRNVKTGQTWDALDGI